MTTKNTPAVDETPKVKKTRAAIKKDKFFLAICRNDYAPNDALDVFLPILGNINCGNDKDKTITEYLSKKAAFKASKTIPDFLTANDVRIISVSPRIQVTTRTITKISL